MARNANSGLLTSVSESRLTDYGYVVVLHRALRGSEPQLGVQQKAVPSMIEVQTNLYHEGTARESRKEASIAAHCENVTAGHARVSHASGVPASATDRVPPKTPSLGYASLGLCSSDDDVVCRR